MFRSSISQIIKYLNNPIFILCFVTMGIGVYIRNPGDLRNFVFFVSFLVETLFMSLGIYFLAKFFFSLVEVYESFVRKKAAYQINPVVVYMEGHCFKLLAWRAVFYLTVAMIPITVFVITSTSFGAYMSDDIITLLIMVTYYLYPIGVFTIYRYIKNKEFRLSEWFKTALVTELLEEKFTEVHFEPRRYLSYYELKNLSLFYGFNVVEGNDLITGKKDGIDFLYSDLHIQKEKNIETEKGAYGTYEKLFRGAVLRIRNNGEKGRLLVVSKGIGHLMGTLTSFDKMVGMEKDGNIETESYSFNMKFDVYGSRIWLESDNGKSN